MSNSNKDFINKGIIKEALKDSIKKLGFKTQLKNPVMFVVYIGSIITTIITVLAFFNKVDDNPWFALNITVFLWFTVLFANFAEAIAEGRGKAQANSLRKAKKEVKTKKLLNIDKDSEFVMVKSNELKKGDIVLVTAGEQIPADGDVIEGVASVDESAITGESAPVIRESGGDRCAVTGGTTVVSDYLIIKITSNEGESFLDKMIAMVEGSQRKKTPNEIALQTFLIALTSIFLVVTVTLYPFSAFSVKENGVGSIVSVTSLVALLVCLAPTTIGALLSSIGIAGMSRLNTKNVLAKSGRAIEAAGDVDVLLLDKTGTITFGNRQASEFIPLVNVDPEELADCAQLSSLADETPEGRSIVILAKQLYAIRGRYLGDLDLEIIPFTARTKMSGVNTTKNNIRKGAASAVKGCVDDFLAEATPEGRSIVILAKQLYAIRGRYLGDLDLEFIPFTARTKMSGVNTSKNKIRKGAASAIKGFVESLGGTYPKECDDIVTDISKKGGTPLVVCKDERVEFIPLVNVDPEELADCAQLSSLGDETPEGRSIVILAKQLYAIRGRYLGDLDLEFIPFTARTKMSGVNTSKNKIRKGAASAIKGFVESLGGTYPKECDDIVTDISKKGGTPLVVCKDERVLGVIYLKDILKDGVKEKFNDLRKMGIKTIMITGDNPLTAAAIAAEAGVDDFLAEATPEGKLELISEYQRKGHLVAMTGDGSNDAPALAQADVAVAMNTGTQAAKEAGNMVDLDSSPTKLIEIVKIGKQLLMTRGALTTFSISNDIAKYFAIIPPLFIGVYPQLNKLNIMNLSSPQSAITSAIIYNALVIIALIPLALKGVKYEEMPSSKLLLRNILIYGLGGIITPFIFIKLIDMFISVLGFI